MLNFVAPLMFLEVIVVGIVHWILVLTILFMQRQVLL